MTRSKSRVYPFVHKARETAEIYGSAEWAERVAPEQLERTCNVKPYVSEVVWFANGSDMRDRLGLRGIGERRISRQNIGLNKTELNVSVDRNKRVIGQSTVDATVATKEQLMALYDEYDVVTGTKRVAFVNIPDAPYVPKVGDVVECLAGSTITNGHTIGTVGTVTAVGRTSCSVQADGMVLYHNTNSVKLSTPRPYAARQADWVRKHGIKFGSKVKVVRKDESSYKWNSLGQMDATIGKVGKVTGIYRHLSVKVDGTTWVYQYNCLEPVKE